MPSPSPTYLDVARSLLQSTHQTAQDLGVDSDFMNKMMRTKTGWVRITRPGGYNRPAQYALTDFGRREINMYVQAGSIMDAAVCS
jgi:hypothetical protein